MTTIYLDKDGVPITKRRWCDLRLQKEYRVLREYDNGVVYVRVEWIGKVDNPSTFSEYYPLFMLCVGNYTAAGEIKSDPVENGKTFATSMNAIKAYEDFLERWTASQRHDDGEFEEADNSLAPPPPPDPDAPTSDISSIKGIEDDGVGAW